MKKTILKILTLLILAFIFTSSTFAQITKNDDEISSYNLPYPGILPDNPLSFFKNIRDEILIFTIRDNEKKAHLFMALSDKHISYAVALFNKQNKDLAIQELENAQNEFANIPPLLNDIKKQGGSISAEFINKLHQSNLMHKQIIFDIIKTSNNINDNEFNKVIKTNLQIKKELDNFK